MKEFVISLSAFSLFLILLIAVIADCVSAQDVIEEWVAIYDRPSSMSNKAVAVAVDDMGNVYVTGNTDDGCGRDIVTIKYDCRGEQIWEATYDGSQYG